MPLRPALQFNFHPARIEMQVTCQIFECDIVERRIVTQFEWLMSLTRQGADSKSWFTTNNNTCDAHYERLTSVRRRDFLW